MSEGFIADEHIAIDATHSESRDAARPSPQKEPTEPKKRGRKQKEEREQWLLEQAELKANLPIYEKDIKEQLNESVEMLWIEAPNSLH